VTRERKNLKVWSLLIVIGWLMALGPGNIEGKFWPVIDNVKLSVVQDPVNPDWVIVSGEAAKLRLCSPRYLDWFKGQRGSGRDLPAEADWGKPVWRDEGPFQFYDWRVRAAPPEVLKKGTFADVLHQCYVTIPYLGARFRQPWLTRSPFWR
jgi:hypothetical protein